MEDERYPRVIEGDALAEFIPDTVAQAVVGRITVINDTTMVMEIGPAGLRSTVAVGLRPPMGDGRPWTIRVERTYVCDGDHAVVADDLPVPGVGQTRPQLPSRAVIEVAITAAAEGAREELGRRQLARDFHAILSWISPGALPTGDTELALKQGRATARWERRGGDVVLMLEVNAGPLGPSARDLFR